MTTTRIRFMRLIVFFDLPMETYAQKRSYANFRRFFLNDGYLMMQKSVYTKLVINDQNASAAIARLKLNKPHYGLVQLLKVTEKQYANIEYISGSSNSHNVIDTLESLLIL